jgi:lipopolysaccharide heptosyltransferase I
MKILIIKPSSLGDVIHALPFLMAVRHTFKNARIDWVISSKLSGILEGNPFINRLIVIDKDAWKRPERLPGTVKEIIELVKTIRKEHYDIVIDLQGLLRSGLITFVSSSPLKIGFDDAREGSRLFYNKKIKVNGSMHAVDKCLEIARSISANTERIEFPLHIDDYAKRKIKKLINNEKGYVVMVPTARWETKMWPPEKFGSLISRLKVPCVITGSSADGEVIQRVISSSQGKGINLCGKTDLKTLVSLLSEAGAVVGNDSGPLHIAAALGVPVIALFGPTDPGRTGPYGWSETVNGQKGHNIKVIKKSVPCSPCFRKKCKAPVCMSSIDVEDVLRELKEYL